MTITPAPAASISYSGGPFCTTSGPVNVTRNGTTGGTYSYTGTGTLTLDPANGTITPSSSTGGTYTVIYTVAAANGCSQATTNTSVTITAAPTVNAGTAVSTCANTGAVNVTAGASATGYSSVLWTSNNGTGTFANAGSLTTATYTPSAADISAGSVTLTLQANGNGNCVAVTSTKTLTINPIPTISVSPLNTDMCIGSIQALVASSTGSTNTITKTFESGNINLDIPDATSGFFGTNPGDITTPITITGIPTGNNVNITNVIITLNVTHPYDGDLNFNLISKNGNIINLINRKGGDGNNFSNTTITWHGGIDLPANGAPYSGSYKPDAGYHIGENHFLGSDYRSNVTDFSNLLSSNINGSWKLYAEDAGKGDKGTINSWSITIEYEMPETNPVTWSPQTDLYTDAGATTPYTGQPLTIVYAQPSNSGTIVYTATGTNSSGCTNSAQATLTVHGAPVVTVTADYCAVPGKVVLTASSDQGGTYLWQDGETTNTIQVDEAGDYSVTVTGPSGCKGYGVISVAQELVTNGNFDAGNDGSFTSRLNAYIPYHRRILYRRTG